MAMSDTDWSTHCVVRIVFSPRLDDEISFQVWIQSYVFFALYNNAG